MSNLSSVSGEVEEEVDSEFPAEYLRFGNVLLRDTVSMPSKTLYGETKGYYEEKKQQLSKSHSGHIGLLTRIYNEIQDLILHKKGNMGDILSKYKSFDNARCNFVDVHERYWMMLHGERDRKIASASYEEQTKRKLRLDSLVNDWRDMIGLSRSEDCKKPESKKSV